MKEMRNTYDENEWNDSMKSQKLTQNGEVYNSSRIVETEMDHYNDAGEIDTYNMRPSKKKKKPIASNVLNKNG